MHLNNIFQRMIIRRKINILKRQALQVIEFRTEDILGVIPYNIMINNTNYSFITNDYTYPIRLIKILNKS